MCLSYNVRVNTDDEHVIRDEFENTTTLLLWGNLSLHTVQILRFTAHNKISTRDIFQYLFTNKFKFLSILNI